MEWKEESLRELNRIGGTTQGIVKKMLAQAIQKRQAAAKLQEQAKAIIDEANDMALTAFAYLPNEEVTSLTNVAGDMLTRRKNVAKKSFDKETLKYSLLDHLEAGLVNKLLKAATKEGKKPENEFSVSFKAGGGK